MKDYTISVYAPQRVTITDSTGATSDPTKGGTVVYAGVSDSSTTSTTTTTTNTTNTTSTTTNTTKNTTTPTTNTTTPTTTTTTTTTVTASLQSALKTAVSQAAAGNSAYTKTSGSYYYVTLGYTPANSTYYFWQYGASSSTYILDVTVVLKSYGQTCVTD